MQALLGQVVHKVLHDQTAVRGCMDKSNAPAHQLFQEALKQEGARQRGDAAHGHCPQRYEQRTWA
eukprot:840595-Amphidinium_carterae.1